MFGGGIGGEGVICFDGEGLPLFRFAEFAEKNGLPPIYDCYAMNVSPSGDVWLNYYNEFPLVQLSDLEVKHLWRSFGCMDKGFAIRENEAIYLRGDKYFIAGLEADGEPDEVAAHDEDGLTLAVNDIARVYASGRGSSFLVNTGQALFEFVSR